MSLSTLDELDDDLPDIFPGEIVHNDNGDNSFKIINQVGAGRCCVVYKAVAVRDGTVVALKCFRQGSNYDGAIQRENYILTTLGQAGNNIVTCHATITYRGFTFFVLELLQDNIRQIIFKNERQGLSPWASVKFAKDLLASLTALHGAGIVHADLKPANVLWSGQEGVFKCIDFGLSFSVEEEDLHQVQSTGYRAPEAESWNEYKESLKVKRKRKLEATFTQLRRADTSEDICDNYSNKTKNDITESNKRRSSQDTQLQHSDSHSSGIFSLENSERSQDSHIEEMQEEQDWRMTRSRISGPPPQPGTPADIWSFGCLLAEVFTGRKLFQSGDKLASVLRPEQLLEMKLGDTETVWTEQGQAAAFAMLKDLIIRCIEEDPGRRLTAEQAAGHEVFRLKLSPSPDPLPTATLRFSRAESGEEPDEEILQLIREECQAYGEITDCKLAGGHALVYFQEVGGAVFARQCLLDKKDEDDITNLIEIDSNKFHVTFYLYTS